MARLDRGFADAVRQVRAAGIAVALAPQDAAAIGLATPLTPTVHGVVSLPAIAPTCPSYRVVVQCPRCEQRAVDAQVFPTGDKTDIVVEHGCSACGMPLFSDAQYMRLQELAWDMECPHVNTDLTNGVRVCTGCGEDVTAFWPYSKAWAAAHAEAFAR